MRLWEIGDIVDVLAALGRPQISLVLRVRNMLEIVLGALVLIGVFVFWCDVTDSWNNVFLWNNIRLENTNPPHFFCDRNASSERGSCPIKQYGRRSLLSWKEAF